MLERERKRQTAIANTSVQMHRWRRLMDPVFSGSASPQTNLVAPQKLPRHLEQSILPEYKQLKSLLAQGKLLQGAWDSYLQIGQTPDTREGMSMVAIGKEVYMFGGQGRTMFEDIRMLDCARKD